MSASLNNTGQTPEPQSRTLKVTWHPNAIRTAVDHATAIVSAATNTASDEVYQFPGGFMTMTDLCCLIDAGRQFLDDENACTCERTYATYDGPQRDCPEHGETGRCWQPVGDPGGMAAPERADLFDGSEIADGGDHGVR